MSIKKLVMVLSFIIMPLSAYQRFPDTNLQNYYFAGNFGFQAPFVSNDMQYYYMINSISNLDLPANTPMRLTTLLGSRVNQMLVNNGTKIILKPDLVAAGKTKDEKKSIYDTLPYVVIERADDFITVYVYLYSAKIGTKLVFNVLAFEDFMMKTNWIKALQNPHTNGWYFGFEFNTANANFDVKPSLFTNQQGISPFFIDVNKGSVDEKINFLDALTLAWYGKVPNQFKTLDPYFPAQYFVALGNGFDFDQNQWNPNVFFQNNITTIGEITDTDVDNVEKILTAAGISSSPS